MNNDYRLIFSLVETPFYGFVIEAYRINVLKNGLWSMDFKKITDRNSNYLNFEITEEEKDLIEEIQVLKDESILNMFSLLKEKKLVFGQLPFNLINLNKHILPWVSKKTFEIINKLKSKDIEIYLKNTNKDSVEENIIKHSEKEIEPHFNFTIEQDLFTYKLTLLLDNEVIDLTNAKIVTLSPCLLLYQNEIYNLPVDFSGVLIKPFFKTEIISIPKAQTKKYLETFVSKIVRKYRAEVNGFSVTTEDVKPQPTINIVKIHKNQFAFTLSFTYGENTFPVFSSNKFALKLKNIDEEYTFIKTNRDFEEENKFLSLLESLDFEKINNTFFIKTKRDNNIIDDPYELSTLLKIISEDSALLKENGFKIDINIQERQYLFEQPKIITKINETNDWFDLQMHVKIGKYEISFKKLIPYIINNQSEYELPDGKIFYIPFEWFSKFKDIALLSEQNQNIVRVQKSQFSLIENFDKEFKNKLSSKLLKLSKNDIPLHTQPKELKTELRPYQKKGMEWMLYLQECALGGCLADDMGLGKTIQVLAYMLKFSELEIAPDKNIDEKANEAELFESYGKRKNHTHLIIVPLSLIHNWTDEIKKFAPSLVSGNYIGNDRYKMTHYFKYFDVILTTYGTIRNDSEILKNFDFHTIILDESQNIKNPLSKSYEAINNLKSKQRFVLSGTPLENSLTDIWTQLNFLNPGILGSFKKYKDSYVMAIEKHNDEDAAKRISKIISPYILRRKKNEVAKDLPDLSQKICYCNMSDEQKSIYEKKKSEIRNYLLENIDGKSAQQRNIIVLSGLMKLRLISNHPKLSDPEYNSNSGKFEEIKEHINKVLAEDHKTIIFSQFVKHLNLVKEYLETIGVKYVMLTGNTKLEDREKNIKKFQKNNEVKFFLITLKAGGVGLNLTQADYVFMLDPWWNPASENQAISRTHRIGQDKKVMVYKFISEDSIEEKIMNLQRKKTELFDIFINSSKFSKLSKQEILDIFL